MKASSVDRSFSKPHLCQRFGEFQPVSTRQLEAARHAPNRYSPVPAIVPKSLWKEYERSLDQARSERRQAWSAYRSAAAAERVQLRDTYRIQRGMIAALPISGADKKRLYQQVSFRQSIDHRELKQKLARQRKDVQRSPHPGTWRHFVAQRAREGDVRATRLLHEHSRRQDRSRA